MPVSRVVNITKGNGKAGEMQLVEVYEDPADYLLGTHGLKGAGGVFARSICTIRITEWNDEAIASLHYYLRAVRATARVQKREDDEDKERARRRFGGSPTGFSFVQALCDPWRERLGLRGASSAGIEVRARLHRRPQAAQRRRGARSSRGAQRQRGARR